MVIEPMAQLGFDYCQVNKNMLTNFGKMFLGSQETKLL